MIREVVALLYVVAGVFWIGLGIYLHRFRKPKP